MLQRERTIVNLQGEWRVALDPQDTGISERWFDRRLAASGFHIPGICAEHGLGERQDLPPGLTKEAVQRLRAAYSYQGAAWYQTDMQLSGLTDNRNVVLFLERIMGETQLWIDGVAIGRQDSLSTPHQFDITRYVSEGNAHQITLRIDNRDSNNIGDWPSARTEQTQTIWHGIVGKAELRIVDNSALDELLIAMDRQRRQLSVTIAKTPAIASWRHLALRLSIHELDGGCVQQESQTLYRWFPEEAERIIRMWSIHPSFCIFSNGNELNGDFQLLREIVQRLKRIQPQILYTLTSNWDRPAEDEDDLFIAQASAGVDVRSQYFFDQLVETTTLNFTAGVQAQSIPVISHEVGQYVVYPNVEEIPRYTGNLVPVNLQRIRADLEQKRLLPYLSDFINASGKLALALYKMEIEAALRTPGMGGIQLLSLHDFPGQSTATVGILDAFYASKHLVKPADFRQFCGETVPLVMMPTLFYASDDDFTAEVQIAHYGAAPLHDRVLEIHIRDDNQRLLFSEEYHVDEVPIGLLAEPLQIQTTPFRALQGRQKLQVTAELRYTPYRNQWDIWVYGDTQPSSLPPSVARYHEWSPALEERLVNGEDILLLPTPDRVKQLAASASDDAGTDLAPGKPAQTDSMKSLNYGPLRGNDGNPATAWIAADAETGHYWQVDLGDITQIASTRIVFNENAVYRYVIQSSLDGVDWQVVVNKTHQVAAWQTHQDPCHVKTRFLRIIYQGLANGVRAGHRQFSAYGQEAR